jgi:hypothetical protein
MALTYTKSHTGSRATTGIAHKGTRRRRSESCTYAGTGFGGGAGAGAAAAARGAGAGLLAAGDAAGVSPAGGSPPPDPVSPSTGNPREERRSRERLRRCSGISVTDVLSKPESP